MPSQGDVTQPVKPHKKALIVTEKGQSKHRDGLIQTFSTHISHHILKLPNCRLLKKENPQKMQAPVVSVMLRSLSGFKFWSYIPADI